MSFSVVQGPVTVPQTGGNITGVVSGNYILVYGGPEAVGNTAPPAISGLKVNDGAGTQLTWTNVLNASAYLSAVNRTYGHSWWISSAVPASIAGTIKVGWTNTPGTNVYMWEISAAAQPTLDASNSGSGSADDPSINLATLTANCLVWSAITSVFNEPTQGAGYTYSNISNSSSFQATEYDVDSGAAGTVAVPWVTSASTDYLISAIALKEQAAGGGVIPGAVAGAQPLMTVVCG